MTVTAGRRITVVAPHTRMDLSLPAGSTIAELVPQLVRLAGTRGTQSTMAGGWELRRLGGPSLTPSSTVDGSGIRDGEHVDGTLPLTARAKDNKGRGIARIEVLVDDVRVHGACGGELTYALPADRFPV